MTHPDLPYWLALTRVPRIGGARIALLEQHFGALPDAWSAPRIELQAAGIDDTTIRSLLRVRSTIEPEAELAPLGKAGIQAFTWHDAGYPPRLKEIADRPPVLFVQGTIEDRDEWSVAVVGTRRVSAYGRQMAEELSRGLAANNITVVSGLARGVDGVAHRAALEAGGGDCNRGFGLGHGLPAGAQEAGGGDQRARRDRFRAALRDEAMCRLLPAPQSAPIRADPGFVSDRSGQRIRGAAHGEPCQQPGTAKTSRCLVALRRQ